VVARDLSVGYVGLALPLVLQFLIVWKWPVLAVPAACMSAIGFGLGLAYLQLFLHEAAHFKLAPSPKWNDVLANTLIGPWVFIEISRYRAIHWRHHRYLGTTQDPERSYFKALGWRFLLEAVAGVTAFRAIRVRRLPETTERQDGARSSRLVTTRTLGLIYHIVMVWSLWRLVGPLGALSWVVAVCVIYPLLGSLRQLLEHRSPEADASVDYGVVSHGRYSRIFVGGVVGAVLGGAGFRFHILHHWDPDISYTNLPEVEQFVRRCPELVRLLPEPASYPSAFRLLFGSGR
jgi:fatty acid desaturase